MAPTNDPGLWLRTVRKGEGDAFRLICFPHAGGAASSFLPLARALPPDVHVTAIQYPGRQDRRSEPCERDAERLAGSIRDAIGDALDGPFAFFGHSMGAVLAFEVTRLLESDGIRPEVLFASSRRAPSLLREESVHQRDDTGLLAEIADLNGTDMKVFEDPDVVRMVLPALRGDYTLIETYRMRPGPPLSCPVTAFVGDSDRKVTIDEVAAWGQHTLGPFAVRVFSGGHFYTVGREAEIASAVVGTLRALQA